jgi:hypothetical protein
VLLLPISLNIHWSSGHYLILACMGACHRLRCILSSPTQRALQRLPASPSCKTPHWHSAPGGDCSIPESMIYMHLATRTQKSTILTNLTIFDLQCANELSGNRELPLELGPCFAPQTQDPCLGPCSALNNL